MFFLNIFGYTFYELAFWFWIYSFLGWCFECIYVAIHERRWVNRGFVTGPFCIIYGFGALVMLISVKPFARHIVVLFLASMLVASLIEVMVHFILKILFHQRWWDYSDLRFHYKGILSLESSIAWGLLSLLLIKILHPIVEALVSIVDLKLGKIVIIVLIVLYVVDFLFSVFKAMKRSSDVKAGIIRVKTAALRAIIIDFFRRK